MKPDWVVNEVKYNLAKGNAKNPSDKKEVKELYVSYGGKLNEVVLPVNNDSTMEEKNETPVEEIVEETPTVETLEEATGTEEVEIVDAETTTSTDDEPI